MSNHTWKTENDFGPDSATLWDGAEAFSFQPNQSEAVQDGITNCPYSFMPPADSHFSSVSLQENVVNWFGYNHADNSNMPQANNAVVVTPIANSTVDTTQTNNTHSNSFANSFNPAAISSNVNITQNYLGIKGSQGLDLNSPPVNLSGTGSYDLIAAKNDTVESFQGFCLTNEPSNGTLDLGYGYDNWMMCDALEPYSSKECNGRYQSMGNVDYIDLEQESSSYEESSISAQPIRTTSQGDFTTASGDFVGYHDSVPCSNDSVLTFHGEMSCAVGEDSALGFGAVLDLSNQQACTQASTHQFDPMARNNVFGNQISEGFIDASLKMYPPHPACTSVSSDTTTLEKTQQSVAEELGNLGLRNNVIIPSSSNIISLMRGTQASTGNYDQPGKMSSILPWPYNHSSRSAQQSNEIRLPGISQVLQQHSQTFHNPERTVSAAAVSGTGVSAVGSRVELAQDSGDVGRRLLKRGSDQRPSSAMLSQCKKRVTEQQFLPPLHSSASTQFLMGQNFVDKICPTSVSHSSTPNILNASSNASSPPLLHQYAPPGMLAQGKKGVTNPNSSTQSLPEQDSFEKIFSAIGYPFITPNLYASTNASITLPLMPAQTQIPSPVSAPPAMFSQCENGVNQQQFVNPDLLSTRSMPDQNSSEKIYPTSATPKRVTNLLHASSTASTPPQMPQHVASDAQIPPLWSSSHALSPLANSAATTYSAHHTHQPQGHPLSRLMQVSNLPKALGTTRPTSMNFSNPSTLSSSSMPNIFPLARRTPTVGPISSHLPNSTSQKAQGTSVQDSSSPAERSSAPNGSLQISTSSAASGKKPVVKVVAPRKRTARKLKATPVPNESTKPASKKSTTAISARALAQLQRTYVSVSPPTHIKWEGLEKPGVSGFNCRICKRDLAFSPNGPVAVPPILPEVAVLSCGHTFHDQCLRVITPQDQASNPPCIPCAVGDI